MNDQHWCVCGSSYRLHNVVRAAGEANGGLMLTSRWWWICHTCFSFEAHNGGN